jgi:hypothetical protein
MKVASKSAILSSSRFTAVTASWSISPRRGIPPWPNSQLAQAGHGDGIGLAMLQKLGDVGMGKARSGSNDVPLTTPAVEEVDQALIPLLALPAAASP